jgi:hypothetical protein
MGFKRCVMPEANLDASARADGPSDQQICKGAEEGCELVGVRSVGEALDALLS